MFREWHPSPEELIASGEAAQFELRGEYAQLRPFLQELKRAREAARLTLNAHLVKLRDEGRLPAGAPQPA